MRYEAIYGSETDVVVLTPLETRICYGVLGVTVSEAEIDGAFAVPFRDALSSFGPALYRAENAPGSSGVEYAEYEAAIVGLLAAAADRRIYNDNLRAAGDVIPA